MFYKSNLNKINGNLIKQNSIKVNKKGVIEFSQTQLNREINSGKLNKIKIKYNGLCEIICNYVLLEDMLGNNHPIPLQEDVQANLSQIQDYKLAITFKENSNFVKAYKNKYGDKITKDNLRKVEDTHILNVTSFVSRLLALFCSIYPCNLFSNAPFTKKPYRNKRLPNGQIRAFVNKEILSEKLSCLEDGFYIKFFAFQKNGFSLFGHSMLIKKICDNTYSFFDPNHGESMNLNLDELTEKINNSVKENHANRIAFIDAKKFVKSFEIQQKDINPSESDNSNKFS